MEGKNEARIDAGKRNSEEFAELGESESIDDILCTEPPLAGDGDAEIEKSEVFRLMGVRIETAEHAKVACAVQQRQSRSNRQGLQFNSIHVPVSAAASSTWGRLTG